MSLLSTPVVGLIVGVRIYSPEVEPIMAYDYDTIPIDPHAVTYWHEQQFCYVGEIDGQPKSVCVWVPCSPKRAVHLLQHGPRGCVRLGTDMTRKAVLS